MEMFGQKYRVEFDQDSYNKDRKSQRCIKCLQKKFDSLEEEGEDITCPYLCKVSTGKEWFYSIKCKYGDISLSGGDQLVLFCSSGTISRKIAEEAGEDLDCLLGQKDALIYFDVRHIDKIFKYVKPKARRNISEKHKRKLNTGRKKHRSQKQKTRLKNFCSKNR